MCGNFGLLMINCGHCSKSKGIFDLSSKVKTENTVNILPPLSILEAQTAATEIRGGQVS